MELHILGTRGVPAKHGGFETFAEQFALYMVSRGHHVTVYCQAAGHEPAFQDVWEGVHRVGLPESEGPKGTIRFDFRSAWAASRKPNATLLTLGYNTAVFSLLHRFRHERHFMNMDGIEWRRQKWSLPQRLWLRMNEWCGAHWANHLIADHPAIKAHLSQLVNPNKITVIPYGADAITSADARLLEPFGLQPGQYYIVIARPEPENSILEMVEAYKLSPRKVPLVMLGNYRPTENEYHAKVLAAAKGANILFPGAIYETAVVIALRYYATAYLHGHQVGGTNPSLVEALAAGNAVIAHRNPFNEWVAGSSARFFSDVRELDELFTALESDAGEILAMKAGSRARHALCFRSELILNAYEQLLLGRPVQVPQWQIAGAEAGGCNEGVRTGSAA